GHLLLANRDSRPYFCFIPENHSYDKPIDNTADTCRETVADNRLATNGNPVVNETAVPSGAAGAVGVPKVVANGVVKTHSKANERQPNDMKSNIDMSCMGDNTAAITATNNNTSAHKPMDLTANTSHKTVANDNSVNKTTVPSLKPNNTGTAGAVGVGAKLVANGVVKNHSSPVSNSFAPVVNKTTVPSYKPNTTSTTTTGAVGAKLVTNGVLKTNESLAKRKPNKPKPKPTHRDIVYVTPVTTMGDTSIHSKTITTTAATNAHKPVDLTVSASHKTVTGNRLVTNGVPPMVNMTTVPSYKPNTTGTAADAVGAKLVANGVVTSHELLMRHRESIGNKELNDRLKCFLCNGYLVNPTIIIDCDHSFCKSCLIKHLESNTPKSRYCPRCDQQINKTKPKLNLKNKPNKPRHNVQHAYATSKLISTMSAITAHKPIDITANTCHKIVGNNRLATNGNPIANKTAVPSHKPNATGTAGVGVPKVVANGVVKSHAKAHELLLRPREPIVVKEFNELIQCFLCKGYLIDATTVIECLHSFCKTCIINHLESNTPKSRLCPRCDSQIHRTKPKLFIRSDPTLQDIIYKLVPGLYKNEMTRRKEFYSKETDSETVRLSNEEKGEMSGERLIFTPEDHIYLSVEYFPQYISHSLQPFSMNLSNGALNCLKVPEVVPNGSADSAANGGTTSGGSGSSGDDSQRRYLKCEGGMRVLHLKKWLKLKYDLKDHNDIEVLYKHDPLLDDYTMIDLAYIYSWRRIMEPPKHKKSKTKTTSASKAMDTTDMSAGVFKAPPMVTKRRHTGKHRHKPNKKRKLGINESHLITTNPVNEPLPPVDTDLLKQAVAADLELMANAVSKRLDKAMANRMVLRPLVSVQSTRVVKRRCLQISYPSKHSPYI
ncbi:unnamed protein product, partial [Oppiella nova]